MSICEDKELNDVIYTAVFGWWLAAAFGAIHQLRSIGGGESVSVSKFLVGVASSGACGCLTAWALESMEVDRMTAAAVIGITGYVGGPLMDKLYDWIIGQLDAALECLGKWFFGGMPPKS